MNIRKKFSAQFILVRVFILFIVYTLITSFVFQSKKLNEYKSEISSLNKQIVKTKQEIEELKKIRYGNLDDDLENLARSRLNMVKPNEIIYIDNFIVFKKVLEVVPKHGIVIATTSFNGRPSFFIAVTATNNANVESSPPDKPSTTDFAFV